MRFSQQRVVLAVFSVAAVQLSLYSCATRPNNYGANAAFLDAAKEAGAPVRADEIVSYRNGAQTVTVAPITTWEQTPATALRNGVAIGFAYFSKATQDIPVGYYTLKASADVSKTGTIPATIQFVDRQGKVAASQQAVAEIHSLTIPPQASTRTSFVTIADEPRPSSVSGRLVVVIWCCPNGECFGMVISI